MTYQLRGCLAEDDTKANIVPKEKMHPDEGRKQNTYINIFNFQ